MATCYVNCEVAKKAADKQTLGKKITSSAEAPVIVFIVTVQSLLHLVDI